MIGVGFVKYTHMKKYLYTQICLSKHTLVLYLQLISNFGKLCMKLKKKVKCYCLDEFLYGPESRGIVSGPYELFPFLTQQEHNHKRN